MSKAASEGELGSLHAVLAGVLRSRIEGESCTAADLSNAIKFLKDNQITCVVEEGSELSALEQSLAAKGKTMTPDQVDLSSALDSLEFRHRIVG